MTQQRSKSPEYMIYAGGQDDLIDTSDEEEYKEGGSEEKHVVKTE